MHCGKSFIIISFSVLLISIIASTAIPAQTAKTTELPGIRVYDANDQFIGILLDKSFQSGSTSVIFIPSLNVATVITEEIGAEPGDIIRSLGNIYFENSHCSGPAYLETFTTAPNILYRIGGYDSPPRYFLAIAPDKRDFIISSKLDFRGDCRPWVNSKSRHSRRGYKAKEIPPEKIPFSLPVALPLRYELRAYYGVKSLNLTNQVAMNPKVQ